MFNIIASLFRGIVHDYNELVDYLFGNDIVQED